MVPSSTKEDSPPGRGRARIRVKIAQSELSFWIFFVLLNWLVKRLHGLMSDFRKDPSLTSARARATNVWWFMVSVSPLEWSQVFGYVPLTDYIIYGRRILVKRHRGKIEASLASFQIFMPYSHSIRLTY